MSQQDVYRIFKNNPEDSLSVVEISKLLNLSVQSVTKAVSILFKNNDIQAKEIIGTNNVKTRLYKLRVSDDNFESALHEYNILKNDPRFVFMSGDGIRELMMITELKKLNEVLENGNKE